MSEKLTNSDIRRVMVGHKSGQRMLPEYLPPEAQGGKGADHHTELMGFQKDFDVVIARTLAQFENGADRNVLAEFLTKESISSREKTEVTRTTSKRMPSDIALRASLGFEYALTERKCTSASSACHRYPRDT